MIDLHALDADLSAQGVRFPPHVGLRYEHGYKGRRFLMLGESHYRYWHNGILHADFSRTFTRDCVQEAIERRAGAKFWPVAEATRRNDSSRPNTSQTELGRTGEGEPLRRYRLSDWDSPEGSNKNPIFRRVAVHPTVPLSSLTHPKTQPTLIDRSFAAD
jgi:hypothetical protein